MAVFSLGKAALSAGYRVVGHETVGSTNTLALQAAAQGEDKLWFAALCQTEGRGRRGRAWQSPMGNLAASLVIVSDAAPAALSTLGFVAGVALEGALERLVPDAVLKSALDGADGSADGAGVRFALKWPNDLLAGGAKLAGILLEGAPRPDGRQALVIGFGVNVVAGPEGVAYPVTALADLGWRGDAMEVFAALAESWVETLALWNGGRGTNEILARWRRSAAGLGEDVAVKREGDVVRGVFEALDEQGRMIVRAGDGRRIAITAGDVHFGIAAQTLQETKD